MTFRIDKGVPLPESRGRKPCGAYAEVMSKMEIGDSFVTEGEKMPSLQSAVRQAAKRARITITARREGEEGFKLRVWRVEGTKVTE